MKKKLIEIVSRRNSAVYKIYTIYHDIFLIITK
jgi:hypothetical protein